MQNPLNQIVRTIFGEPRLEDVSRDALHLLTVKYPYSAPLHLLYARRLRDMGDSRYPEAVSLAALHFSNPHWLQHQLAAPLSDEASAESPSLRQADIAIDAEALAENREMEALPPTILPEDGELSTTTDQEDVAFDAPDTGTPVWPKEEYPPANLPPEEETLRDDVLPDEVPEGEVTFAAEQGTVPAEASHVETSVLHIDETPPSDMQSEGASETGETVHASLSEGYAFVSETTPETVDASVIEEGQTETEAPDADPAVASESPVAAQEEPGADNGVTRLDAGGPADTIREVDTSEFIHVAMPEDAFAGPSGDASDRPAWGEVPPPIETHASDDGGAIPRETPADGDPDIEEAATAQTPMITREDGFEGESSETLFSDEGEASQPMPPAEDGEGRPLDVHSDSHPVAGNASDAPTVGTEESAVVDMDLLPVEPLHLSDYLASQGIVVGSELELPSDAQGERSFTGWLRTMKRFQPDRSSPSLSEEEEDSIRSEAEASNLDEDVITEAMAEVYARQGLIHKAIAIYDKLSLFDPDRSATFAARISQLKGQLP